MKIEQIEKYEYCKKHLIFINECKEKLPFKHQHYVCGSRSPSIEHMLERIHNEMYRKTAEAIQEAKNKVEKIIEES